MAQSLFLDDMTPPEIDSYIGDKHSILIPLGVTEPHGDHLPVGTDSICAVGLCETLSRELGFAIAPPVFYGLLDRMVGHTGALTLSRSTYTVLLEEIFEQLAAAHIQFVVVCNGHGPNRLPIIDAIRRNVARHSMQFLIVEWWMVAAQYIQGLFDTADIGHGGIGEVSAILHYHPELVKFDRITQSSFGREVPGVTAFPLQKTAMADDSSCLINPDKERMRELMLTVEHHVVEAIQHAYALFTRG